MNTRLKQFLAAENLSQAQFADTIKVVRASISHVLSGRNKPGYDFIRAIMNSYPNLNIEWLLMGKGKMYKETAPAPPREDTDLPLLFAYDEDFTPASDEVPETVSASMQEPLTLTENIPTNTISKVTQTVIKQRKAIKVTVFYDDGTYQDL